VSAPPSATADAPLQFGERMLAEHRARWLATVDEAYGEMERRIESATRSIRLETYILREEGPATWLCTALLRARARGVEVFMLIDAFGSEYVQEQFLRPLHDAGIQLRIFNPKRLLRLSFRNHRKLLTVDDEHAVLGGFNIAPEYAGDGVSHGWCDTGMVIHGPIVAELAHSFDLLYRLAPFTGHAIRRFRHATGAVMLPHLRRAHPVKSGPLPPISLLMSGPGMPQGVLRRRLRIDLFHARDVAIASGYFLPELPVRKLLYRTLRLGGRVRVLLAGKSDVPMAQRAAERLYRRLLRRRVEIFEYQPQILHAKLLVMDDLVFVGSCNLDRRSLHINYELLLRLHWPELAADARRWFEHALLHSQQVNARDWRKRRSFMRRMWSRIAYLLLARVDPLVARRRFRALS
jgi:cardiolipin synthase